LNRRKKLKIVNKKNMGFEGKFIEMKREDAERNRKKFGALPKKDKEEKIKLDHKKALEMKGRVDYYVSPDQIVSGIKMDGIFRTSELFRNKPVEDFGQVNMPEAGKDYETPFNDVPDFLLNDIEENRSKYYEEIKKLFKDIPLIDLGAGHTQQGYFIARILGAKGYVGVEPYNSAGLERELVNGGRISNVGEFNGTKGWKSTENTMLINPKIEKTKKIPFAIAEEDALTFLRRLPDHSVGICSFGVDGYVMSGDRTPESRKKIDKYIKEVNKEISRVLHTESAVIY
jgi:hypothetical protein